jgi:hypothetical protein
MPRRKSKRATTCHQRPNALSSLDIYIMMSYQCFQALCAISLVRSHRMLILSMVLDKDDDDSLLLLYHRHLSLLHNNNFLFLLDSMFMNIEPEDTSVEWPYGDITVLFHIMHSKHRKKYFLSTGLLNTMLHQQFCVVFFIYNCYVCFNGNKFTKFFDLSPPSLAEYLEV